MLGASPITMLDTVADKKQARSERTLYRLLDAAEALIVERGLAGLSIPEVARRAQSSVGGFHPVPVPGPTKVYRRILAAPDHVITETSSYSTPPVPAAR